MNDAHVFQVEGWDHVTVMHLIAPAAVRALPQRVTSLAARHDEVTRGLDTLLLGF